MQTHYLLLSLLLLMSFPSHSVRILESPDYYTDKIMSIEDSISESLETDFIDIRGVGDSSWTNGSKPQNGQRKPKEAGFSRGLELSAQNKRLLVGDINFINWESVVGFHCKQIRQTVSFYFLSHPDNIQQAYNYGFNLFGLSNNHSQDCDKGQAFDHSDIIHGPLMSSEVFHNLESSNDLIGHGTGTKESVYEVKELRKSIKGQDVSIGFASIVIQSWDIPNALTVNYNQTNNDEKFNKLMNSFENNCSDIKILTIHVQDSSGHMRKEGPAFRLLKKYSQDFIKKHNGHVVFGHGPHTWGGVKVIEKNDGKRGVVFTSLGNFIHQGLLSNDENYLGRALFTHNFDLKEVQVFPFINKRDSSRNSFVKFYSLDKIPKEPFSNFLWETSTQGEEDQVGMYYSVFR